MKKIKKLELCKETVWSPEGTEALKQVAGGLMSYYTGCPQES